MPNIALVSHHFRPAACYFVVVYINDSRCVKLINRQSDRSLCKTWCVYHAQYCRLYLFSERPLKVSVHWVPVHAYL